MSDPTDAEKAVLFDILRAVGRQPEDLAPEHARWQAFVATLGAEDRECIEVGIGFLGLAIVRRNEEAEGRDFTTEVLKADLAEQGRREEDRAG